MNCPQCEANKDWIDQLNANIKEKNQTLATCTAVMKDANTIIIQQHNEIMTLRAQNDDLRRTQALLSVIRGRANGRL
jgi:hypothetical protein